VCGIVGIFSFGAQPEGQAEQALRMREAIRHRGPDDAGLWTSPDGRMVLGQRRLSIVDLSPAGHQPMANETDTVWLTFNGEIYNHASYREGLLARGHTFRSRTDTEAILHLYEEHGPDVVHKLDGMFAFGLWDTARQRLLLARDRLGKKPLYYRVANGRLIFGSEIKALLAHDETPRELDMTGLDLYLAFGEVPAPHSLFAGIRKVPAGHRLVCERDGAITIERYWSPLGDAEHPWPSAGSVKMDDAVVEVRTLLHRAVEKRLMADVPVGAFLSGGVDSSANVALMSRLISTPIQTYSLGFEGFGASENFHDLPYARQVATQFKCDHHELTVTADECQRILPELVIEQDEPIGDPACLPMHFLCKKVRQDGVIVVLVGEGSDEVFGGYPEMAQILGGAGRRWAMVNRLPGIAKSGLHLASRLLGAPPGRTDVLRRARDGEPLYWGLDVVFWETEKDDLLALATRAATRGTTPRYVREIYADLAARQPGADLLQTMSAVELAHRLPELLLMRVDKISMAHSIEARAPFLDADLVAYGLSLPHALKIRAPHGKVVLKKALEGILPDSVLYRKKQGFRVPLPEWLRGPLAQWARRQVLEGPLMRRGLFNRAYVESLWQRHQQGTFDHSFDLWCLINLSAWYERWIDPGGAA
jgi:asparagine synthase (glutamine-hydrolysing)